MDVEDGNGSHAGEGVGLDAGLRVRIGGAAPAAAGHADVAMAEEPPDGAAAAAPRQQSPFRAGGGRPRPLSNSRGRPTTPNDLRPRPPSRGKSAGRRRTMRYVNDTFAHAYGVVWASSSLTEEELAERLAHMSLTVSHRPFLAPLVEQRDLLRAFRRGELGAPQESASSSAAAHRGAPQSMTMRALLQQWYSRIDRRCRPLLLKEARRSVRAAAEGKPTFLLSLELLLQRFVDGTAGGLLAGDSGAADGSGTGALPLEALEGRLGLEFAAAMEAPPVLVDDGEDEEGGGSGARAGGGATDGAATTDGAAPRHHPHHQQRRVRRQCLQLHFREAYSRVLTHALAAFYSLRAASWDDAATGARLMRVRLPPAHVASAGGGNGGSVNLGAPSVYRAARGQLVTAWGAHVTPLPSSAPADDGAAAGGVSDTAAPAATATTGAAQAPGGGAPRAGSPPGGGVGSGGGSSAEKQDEPAKATVTAASGEPAPAAESAHAHSAAGLSGGVPLVPLLLLFVRIVSGG